MTKKQRFEPRETISRRAFLHHCGICTGCLVLPSSWLEVLAVADRCSPPSSGSATDRSPLEFRFFNPAQAVAVEAVTDQIIPADQHPGAKWAGVVHYIDLALAGDLKDFRSAYNRGIQRLEALAHDFSGKTFAELDFATQTSLLERLEQDQSPITSGLNGAKFFQLVRKHTLEGFFGDPKYGGNRDSVGWRILEFEG